MPDGDFAALVADTVAAVRVKADQMHAERGGHVQDAGFGFGRNAKGGDQRVLVVIAGGKVRQRRRYRTCIAARNAQVAFGG